MKNVNLKKLAMVVALAAPLASTHVSATDLVSNANVNVLAVVGVANPTPINFGTMSNENGTCTMASGGGLSGSAGQTCSGTETPGVFDLTGTGTATLVVSVTAGAAVNGVTYNPVIDGTLTPALIAGAISVNVIGNMVFASATVEDKDISYTFTANYQ